ncbi:MAG: glycosyltransferase family 2 protein [Caulobacteraceae bacterium]
MTEIPIPGAAQQTVDVSFVVPCLNETPSLPACVERIREAIADLKARHGLSCEIVVADNGSTDGSQALAENLGARVVDVERRGYGAALIGGLSSAKGRFLVMGDADGSYDFREAAPMVEALMKGADLVMGSRFEGEVKKGAMPWKNRWIGNPLLTGVLNLLFRAHISDAHCGLRALSAGCFARLGLTGAGMEFASEMVIKAALKRERIVEVPVTLWPDLRNRPPHLRPWRDGWRHLRYLFMLSPTWLYALPACLFGAAGAVILGIATWYAIFEPGTPIFFGNHWAVVAAAMVGLAHIAAILALATHLHGVRSGVRRGKVWTARLSRWISLETMIGSGLATFLGGLVVLLVVALHWLARNFGPQATVTPTVDGALLVILGAQNILGGFLLAILAGNEANFLAL